jgi:hypothetical protein
VQSAELVAEVMQPVDAGDQVERAVGTPGAQRRLDQPQKRVCEVMSLEDPNQIDAGDLHIQSQTLGDLSGLDQRLARTAAKVQPRNGRSVGIFPLRNRSGSNPSSRSYPFDPRRFRSRFMRQLATTADRSSSSSFSRRICVIHVLPCESSDTNGAACPVTRRSWNGALAGAVPGAVLNPAIIDHPKLSHKTGLMRGPSSAKTG